MGGGGIGVVFYICIYSRDKESECVGELSGIMGTVGVGIAH